MYPLRVPDELSAGSYLLQLIGTGEGGAPVISNPEGELVSFVATGPITIGKRSAAGEEPTRPVDATFADNIRLMGYDLETGLDNSLSVTLYWQAEDEIHKDYTVFLHLLSPEGDLFTQRDSQPLLPTSMWVPDIQITDFHNLKLPTELPLNAYQLRIGLYHWPELVRVPIIASGCLDAANDTLLVGQILLDEAQTPDKVSCPTMYWINIERE